MSADSTFEPIDIELVHQNTTELVFGHVTTDETTASESGTLFNSQPVHFSSGLASMKQMRISTSTDSNDENQIYSSKLKSGISMTSLSSFFSIGSATDKKLKKPRTPLAKNVVTHGPITVKELIGIFQEHMASESFYEQKFKVWPVRLLAVATLNGFLVWIIIVFCAEHWIKSPLVWDSAHRDRTASDVMVAIRKEYVPTLKSAYRSENDAYFSGMHQSWNATYYEERGCISQLFSIMQNTVKSVDGSTELQTSPALVQNALEYFHMDEIPAVMDSFSSWLQTPQSTMLSSMLDASETCLKHNPLLQTIACAIIDDTKLQKPYPAANISELAISARLNLHRALVLDRVIDLTNADSQLAAQIVNHIVGHYYKSTRQAIAASKLLPEETARALDRQVDLVFLSYKQTATYPNAITADVGIVTEAVMRSNIAVGAALDLKSGLEANSKVGNLLNGNTNKLATVDNMATTWDLGKDWMDTYTSWNMAFGSRFATQGGYWAMSVPSVSCQSMKRGDSNRFIDSTKMSSLLQMSALEEMLSEHPGQYANPALTAKWGAINLAHARLPVPARDQMKEYFVSLCKNDENCMAQWDITYTDMLSPDYLSNADIGLFYTLVLIISSVLAGTALELFIGVYWACDFFPRFGEHWLQFANCIYSLFMAVAFYSRSIFGMPFAVMALWKLGYPETLVCLNRTWVAWEKSDLVASVYNYMNSLGLILHHLSCVVVLSQLYMGRWLLIRHLRSMVVPLVMQHWVSPILEFFPTPGVVLVLVLELLFEWEVLANLQYADSQDYDITGRGTAMTMVFAHWMYLLAYALEQAHSLVKIYLCTPNDSINKDAKERNDVQLWL